MTSFDIICLLGLLCYAPLLSANMESLMTGICDVHMLVKMAFLVFSYFLIAMCIICFMITVCFAISMNLFFA